MTVSIIAAMSKNFVIGNNGKIPWKIPGEQKRFKELTTGKTIIIGRKSFEEIGKPLPNRKSIVISKTKSFSADNCVTVPNLEDAFALCKDEKEIFIAGGGQIYKDTINIAKKIYLTIVEAEIDGDVFFPEFDKNVFKKTCEERMEGIIPYTYFTFERRNHCK